jgi:hypothetical protein
MEEFEKEDQAESEYYRSDEFKKNFRKTLEEEHWGKNLPIIGMTAEWKNGLIVELKKENAIQSKPGYLKIETNETKIEDGFYLRKTIVQQELIDGTWSEPMVIWKAEEIL